MSRTFRKGKFSNKNRDGFKNNDFWLKHDPTEERDGMNQSFRGEEKQYFQKFEDTKYSQKPKSRGYTR